MTTRASLGFFRSIRFRLTAWYTLILIAVIVVLGLTFSWVFERELRSDVDERIERTAYDIKAQSEPFVNQVTGQIRIEVPPPEIYSFPSLLIQIVDERGAIELTTENLGERTLPSGAAPAGSAEPVFETVELDGAQIRTVHLPLVLSPSRRTIGAINVGEPLIQLNQTLDAVRRLLTIGALVAVALAAIGGWFLAGRALRPVDRITQTAAAIASGRGSSASLATRLEPGDSRDELARLAVTFNRMLDQLQETFAGQGRFIADASHELRTPLTAIRGNVEVLSRQTAAGDVAPDVLAEALADLRRESARMGRLIDDLLLLARAEASLADAEASVRRPVALADVAGEALRTAGAIAQGQRLRVDADARAVVLGDADRLVQLLVILLDNALRHTPADGEVAITAAAAGDAVELRVSDTGSGIAPEHLPHLFERFYRADTSRHRGSGGTGLGLAIAKAIVQAHGGTIGVESRLDVGTTFTVRLPRSSAA